ncbi:MAG: hypothetical protein PHP35_00550 [Candidatus Colwellbacteria bacterium]|nr:hypothetical protein [Candidatus Colwellbacteria bacterium]
MQISGATKEDLLAIIDKEFCCQGVDKIGQMFRAGCENAKQALIETLENENSGKQSMACCFLLEQLVSHPDKEIENILKSFFLAPKNRDAILFVERTLRNKEKNDMLKKIASLFPDHQCDGECKSCITGCGSCGGSCHCST